MVPDAPTAGTSEQSQLPTLRRPAYNYQHFPNRWPFQPFRLGHRPTSEPSRPPEPGTSTRRGGDASRRHVLGGRTLLAVPTERGKRLRNCRLDLFRWVIRHPPKNGYHFGGITADARGGSCGRAPYLRVALPLRDCQ